MLRDQCEDYCQCTFCKKKPQKTSPFNVTASLPLDSGRSKDELYFRTLNESLRLKCLMDSSRNAHRFRPDEKLQSTRGEMARAALTIPVRRRDRLQELLILENKERMKAERQLRRSRREAGLPDLECGLQDRAVGTADDDASVAGVQLADSRKFGEEAREQHAADLAPQPMCSAEDDLLYALQTIKQVVDEHGSDKVHQPLTSEHIYKLRTLLREQNEKTKKMIAECPESEDRCAYSSFAKKKAGQKGHVKDPVFPSINDRTVRRINYSQHPYGSGVVWLPVTTNDQGTNFETHRSAEAEDDAYENYQYCGSTHNKYTCVPRTTKTTVDDGETRLAVGERSDAVNKKSTEAKENGETMKATCDVDGKKTKQHLSYKSSAAFWRTTNQERAAQMQRFLEFKKLHDDASKVYAAGAIKRNANSVSPVVPNGTE